MGEKGAASLGGRARERMKEGDEEREREKSEVGGPGTRRGGVRRREGELVHLKEFSFSRIRFRFHEWRRESRGLCCWPRVEREMSRVLRETLVTFTSLPFPSFPFSLFLSTLDLHHANHSRHPRPYRPLPSPPHRQMLEK